MGGKGPKVQVTEYYMSQHFGVCSPVDALLKITVKEKTAWSGYLSGQATLAIDEDDLFGGVKKEGGVRGTVHFLPGAADQVLPDVLAQRLGRANGADAPGYRGLASLFFIGSGGHRGFYWTANNPYLPGVWSTVRRAPIGLTAGYALVPRPGSDFHPWNFETAPTTFINPQFSPDRRLLYAISSDFMVWDLESRSMATRIVFGGGAGIGVGIPYAFAPDAIYATSAVGNTVVRIGYDGTFTDLAPTMGTIGFERGVFYAGGQIILLPGSFAGQNFGQFGGTSVAAIPTNYFPSFAFDDIDGNAIAVGGNGSAHELYVGPILEDGDLIDTTAYGTSGDAFAFDNGTNYVVTQGTYRFLVGKTRPYAIIAALGGTTSEGLPVATFNAVEQGSATFWSGTSQYRSSDLSLIRTIDLTDWPPSGHDETNALLYDWLNNSFISTDTITDPGIIWRDLDRGDLDANPAHVIYEALTNLDWGMGSPSSLIDVDSFEDAGVVLFDEPLGLSMIWTRQSSIQDFIQEVLDHIQGALFVDPQTGLLTLKLIRGDYDVGTLPTIDPSNATLTNFGRKLWGEIVNEISVTWTNPDNEQDETVTVHDLASIATQGGIISDSRNYYGVRYAALAQRLAARDLRSAGAPLAACDAELDRSLWFLRPASVVLLDWPEYGLVGLVMRVTAIDYGKPGDMTLKVSLIEDVFGLDAGDYVDPPSTSWEDTSAAPSAMSEQEALTLPYYMAKNAVTSIEGAAYPEVIAGVLGASANADVYGFELWGEVSLSDGSTEWQSLASLNIVGRAELTADLDAEAVSTGVTFSSFIGSKSPQQAGFAIIGASDEDGNELALITAASSTYSLSRGVLDTVPRAWIAGTPVWFIDGDALFEDTTARSVGEVVEYRLRTRTSQGMLNLFLAPLLTATMTDRPWLPSRPAKLEIGGVQFNTAATPVDMIGESVIPVSWANRNRLNEDVIVLGWTDATVTPEDGQTTTITVFKTDGVTVLDTITALSGTTHDVPVASFGSEAIALVKVSASRTDDDGTFDSLQTHGIYVQVDVAVPVGMALESDTALARTVTVGSTAGRSNETDAALALGVSGSRVAGRSDETDTGLALTVAAGRAAGRSDETDAALALAVTSGPGPGGPFTTNGFYGPPDSVASGDYTAGAEFDSRQTRSSPVGSATCTGIAVFFGTTVVNGGKMKPALYADNGSNAPGSLLASGPEYTIATADALTTKNLLFTTPVTLTANTKYHVAWITDSASKFRSCSNGNTKWASFTYASGVPGTAPSVPNSSSAIVSKLIISVAQGVAGYWDQEIGSGDYFLAANEVDLIKITTPASGTCSADAVVLRLSATVTVGGKMKGVIYSNNAGAPDALLGTGSEVTVAAANTELTSTFSGVTLQPSTDYWIGCHSDNASHLIGQAAALGATKWKGSLTYASGPPGTITSPTSSSTLAGFYLKFS